ISINQFKYKNGVWSKTNIYRNSHEAGEKSLAIGDCDNDGLSEIYFSKDGSNGILYQLKFGTSSWTSTKIGSFTSRIRDLAISDCDNDGKLELYVACNDGYIYKVYYSNGWKINSIGSILKSGLQEFMMNALSIGDCDYDGRLEVYLGTAEKIVSTYSTRYEGHLYQFKYTNAGWARKDIAMVSCNENYIRNIGIMELIICDADCDGKHEVYGGVVLGSKSFGEPGHILQFKYDGMSWNKTDFCDYKKEGAYETHIGCGEQEGINSISFGDVDNDGQTEIYGGIRKGDIIYQFRPLDSPYLITRGIGVIGGLVEIKGRCFGKNEVILLEFEGQSITQSNTDGTGSFLCTFNLPEQTSGTKVIRARGLSSGKIATYPFFLLGITITDAKPKSGPNIGTFTLSILGGNLNSIFQIKLTRNSLPDIFAEKIEKITKNKLLATFNLKGALPGIRNIILINQNGDTASLPLSFCIIEPNPETPGIWERKSIGTFSNSGELYFIDSDKDENLEAYILGPGDGSSWICRYKDGQWASTRTWFFPCSDDVTYGDLDYDGETEFYIEGCNMFSKHPIPTWEKRYVRVKFLPSLFKFKSGRSAFLTTRGDGDTDGLVELYTPDKDDNLCKVEGYNTIWVRKNTGEKTWIVDSGIYFENRFLEIGDVDGDNILELYGIRWGWEFKRNLYSVYQLKFNGEMWVRKEIAIIEKEISTWPFDMEIADIDRDGRDEIYIIYEDEDLYQIKYENGIWKKEVIGNGGRWDIEAGDGDNNGTIELYVSWGLDGRLYQYEYKDGKWIKTVIGQKGGDLVITDGDSDGKLEIYSLFGNELFQFKPIPTNEIKITVIPKEGTIGTKIEVDGYGFFPNEVIRIDFGKTLSMTTALTSSNGAFLCDFSVNAQSEGIVIITGYGLTSGKIATTDFFIKRPQTLISLSSRYMYCGGSISVSGSYFGINEVVNIDLGTHIGIAQIRTDSFGQFLATFTVSSQPLGRTVVTARGNYVATASLVIVPEKKPKIKGYIRTTDGKGIRGILIHLQEVPYGESKFHRSTESGYYEFSEIPLGKDWKISLVDTERGEWLFNPEFREYKFLVYDIENENYTGWMMGSLSIKPSPSSGETGRIITIEGGVFQGIEAIRIDFGNALSLTSTITNSKGIFQATFTVPVQSLGTKTITAYGISSGKTATSSFFITWSPPNITIYKSANKTLVAKDGTITYTITYKNESGGTTTDVVIIDVLPDEVELQEVIIDIGQQSTVKYWYDDDWQEILSEKATRLRLEIPEILPGQEGTVSFTVKVK
ncbi:TPA: hypothetical protein DCX16_04230, partial [bacterium]|nr:hypothetical protein [bacterium]